MSCILTYWSSAGHGPSVPSFDPLTQLHHDTWHWPVGRYHRCRPRGSPAQSCQSNHPAPAPAMNANGSTSWSPKVPLMCSVWFILTKGIYLVRKEEGESCHWNIIQLSFKGAGCASTQVTSWTHLPAPSHQIPATTLPLPGCLALQAGQPVWRMLFLTGLVILKKAVNRWQHQLPVPFSQKIT